MSRAVSRTVSRVVLAGCGGISRNWLEAINYSDRLELVGLVDLYEASAEARAAEFGFTVPTGSDLGAMLARTEPDMVFDCTVPEAHHDVTLRALQAGAHVFGEKPMADSLNEAREMVRAAQASGRVYAVMQNRRYDPVIRALRDVLRGGVIGKVTAIHADFFIAAHFGGFRETMRHVLIKDMAIHTFDAARFLTGTKPRSVYCHEWNPEGSWYAHDASASAVFEMTDGVVFTYRGSWCAEGLHTPWEGAWRISGTKGSVVWNGSEVRCEVVGEATGLVYAQQRVEPPTPETDHPVSWHAAAIDAFAEAVHNAEVPETVCDDNVHSLAMVLGAAESSETRRLVELAAVSS